MVGLGGLGHMAVKIAKAALNANAGTSIPYDAVDALGQAVLFESGEKHRRMAAFLDKKKFQVVHPVLPMDLLGIYILLPE